MSGEREGRVADGAQVRGGSPAGDPAGVTARAGCDGTAAEYTGTPVVAGIAYAPVVQAVTEAPDPGARVVVPEDARADESARFGAAAAAVADRLGERAACAHGAAAEVLAATAAMARDRGWVAAVRKNVDSGAPAPHAVTAATATFADMFRKAGGLMAERVTDLEDVRDRVVAELLGRAEPGVPVPERPSVLAAADLAPADTAGLRADVIVAIVTERGGPTSHTAIIARQLGIPCVVAAAGVTGIGAGRWVLVDGGSGRIEVEPPAESARGRVAESRRAAEAARAFEGPCATADGHPVSLLANVQDGASAEEASAGVAEGVGLLRTELAFLDRDSEPPVAEQAESYARALGAFPGGKVVIRTLDAGSDKPLRFVDHGEEANPALGVRGIRVAGLHPGILDRQLDAIADGVAAAAGNGVDGGSGGAGIIGGSGGRAEAWVMAPMVATVDEARRFAAAARGRGLTAGVMVEVPAAAIMAEQLLAEVDFVSIGTNDLTQYTMAADRMAGELAEFSDPWQPAVLRLVRTVAAAGVELGKPVGVCGEAAADPLLACVLTGLGVTSLSAAPAALGAAGAALAGTTLAQCTEAARRAVAAEGPGAARDAARAAVSG